MKRREQLILVAVAGVALLVAFYIALLSPKLKETKSLGKTLSAMQARRDAAVAAVANAQAAQASYVSNVKTITALAPAIPPSDATSPLLRALDSAAVASGVDFTTIQLASTGAGSATRPGVPGGAAAPGGAVATTGTVPPGYSVSSPYGIPSVQYTLKFAGDYLKLQKFLAALQGFVHVRGNAIAAHGRLLDVQGMAVTKGQVTMSVTGYLLAPSDQAPLVAPLNAPAVPGVERASATPGQGTTKIASATGASS